MTGMIQRIIRRLVRDGTAAARHRNYRIPNDYHRFRETSRRQVFLSLAVFCNHNRPINGYYFEFGCHGARTMRMAWDTFHTLYDWTYVAFDSFEGLPEIKAIDRMSIWRQGDLKTTEEAFIKTVVKHGMARQKLLTVKGFYHESLTEELKQKLLPTQAAVIYIDCDLYESTVPILAFVIDFLQQGTVIVFDDWFCFYGNPDRGERRAWREFLACHPDLVFQDFFQTSETQAFIFLGSKEARYASSDHPAAASTEEEASCL
jgi:O-methyltransferase